jgi:predicted RNase H-like HicB family nuclease
VNTYHVLVIKDEGWYVGRVLERPGITTQGKTLDHLVEMLHDAIDAMWGEKQVSLELLLRAPTAGRKRRHKVA